MLAEKYRPKTLSEVVGQDHILPFFKGFAKTKQIPHMLFVGPAGVGKTSVAMALARDIFGDEWRKCFYELNASDDRGIDVVRNKIKSYAKAIPIQNSYKIIFLDEADFLTREAQPALRRIIEDNSETCRFILSCNYPQKIIEPILDRLVEFRFRKLKLFHLKQTIKKIVEQESIKMSPSAVVTLAVLSDGSLRRALNVLCSFKMAGFTEVTEEDIRKKIFMVDFNLVRSFVHLLTKGSIEEIDKKLDYLLYEQCYDVTELLKVLYEVVKESKEIPTKAKLQILPKIGDFEYRISVGASPDIQLRALIANIVFVLKKYLGEQS
ncbi:MAG: replication factor C small subunit [Candidatus Heimdallarchaeaceae archaeon]